ncbi:Protein of unknown function DUF829 TMEM53 [Trinorchestia longiramus]|nr:Protein of unknown function DUF829 TMEM53 [Trinorchestia longiramus]
MLCSRRSLLTLLKYSFPVLQQSTSRSYSSLSVPSLTIAWRSRLVQCSSSVVSHRYFCSIKFSQHLEYFSVSSEPHFEKNGSMCVTERSCESPRPLVLLMVWLMSKHAHITKYTNFYNSLGVDVLKVRISPLELLQPTKGSQMVAGKVLEFLHQNPAHSPVLVHGFSVGCYLFCEALVQIEQDLDTHGPLLERFVGQIWDSGVDIYAIPDGVSKIASNKATQQLIKRSVQWMLKVRHDSATVHYEKASKMLNEAYLRVPGLFLFSDKDSISTPAMNAYVCDNWTRMGIPVYSKCFSGSPHVAHFSRHPSEYKAQVTQFLHAVGFLQHQHKVSAAV